MQWKSNARLLFQNSVFIIKFQTHLVWTFWENGPNAMNKNYDRIGTWRMENTRSSPKNMERWDNQPWEQEVSKWANETKEGNGTWKSEGVGRRYKTRNIFIYLKLCFIFRPYLSCFGGLVVSMLVSGTQDRGFEPGQNRRFFGRKYPQHAFLRRGNKAVYHMSQICGI
jgi:hypothetical protein